MWFRRLKTIDAHLEGGIPPDVREAKAPIKSVWMDTDIVGGRLPGNKQNTMTQVTSAELPCACNILRAAKAAVTLLTPQKPCLLRHAKGDAIDDEEWCMASVLPVPSPLHRMHKKRGLHAARDVCGRGRRRLLAHQRTLVVVQVSARGSEAQRSEDDANTLRVGLKAHRNRALA